MTDSQRPTKKPLKTNIDVKPDANSKQAGPVNDPSASSNTPRKRVSQACDRCRSRKDKCDGKRPVCSSCAALGQVCSYDPSTKKRGLPEGYVRGLEKLWGVTIREASGIEDIVLSIIEEGDNPDSRLAAIWNDRENAEESLVDTWRKSRISRELERLLPILELVEDKSTKRKRQESTLNRGVENNGTAPTPAYTGPGTIRTDGSPATFADSPVAYRERRHTLTTEKSQANEQIELPARAWHLLDVYFSYTHCWLPIIEKHSLLKTSYQYPTTISCSDPGSGDHAALWAILAYADCQNTVFRRSQKSEPLEDDRWTVDILYKHARNLIPTEEGSVELGHVQALLILTLLNMGQNHWSRAWMLIGQAARMSIDLGLGEPSSEMLSIKASERKQRGKHVLLGCFTLDTLVAARLGRSPQLRKTDLAWVGLVEEDGLDEWDPWMDCLRLRRNSASGARGPTSTLSTFNRYVRILEVLNSLLCDDSLGTSEGSYRMLKTELDLCCNLLSSTPVSKAESPLLPHHYHLHFAHLSTTAFLNGRYTSMQGTPIDSRVQQILERHYDDYGLIIAPPTFDPFIKISQRIGRNENRPLQFDGTKEKMQKALAEIVLAWPTFKDDGFYYYQQQQREPNFPIPTTNHYAGPQTGTVAQKNVPIIDNRFENYKSMPRPSMNGMLSAGSYGSNYTNSDQSILEAAIRFDPSVLSSSTGLSNTPSSSSNWPAPSPAMEIPLGHTTGELPQQHFVGSVPSDIDGDSMFNEFATLDAMEWTNNWDQSLHNLGFTDPEHMNQDFYSFIREPDPLYSNNNLVQQLLSNSSELRGSTINMDESFLGFSNPHVEASQILQALSSAQDLGRPVERRQGPS